MESIILSILTISAAKDIEYDDSDFNRGSRFNSSIELRATKRAPGRPKSRQNVFVATPGQQLIYFELDKELALIQKIMLEKN